MTYLTLMAWEGVVPHCCCFHWIDYRLWGKKYEFRGSAIMYLIGKLLDVFFPLFLSSQP